MTKSDVLEIINQYDEDVNFSVEYIGDDIELEQGDCFKISAINSDNNTLYFQIGGHVKC